MFFKFVSGHDLASHFEAALLIDEVGVFNQMRRNPTHEVIVILNLEKM